MSFYDVSLWEHSNLLLPIFKMNSYDIFYQKYIVKTCKNIWHRYHICMNEGLNTVSDIFVKKLAEKKWKILTREALEDMWSLSGGSKSRFAYWLGKVKNQSLIFPIGWWLYSIGSDIIEWDNSYWKMVSLLISRYSPSGGIIAHEKSMEYYLHNYEIPKCLVLYTRDTDKRISIGEYDIHMRTLKTWEKSWVKNMYRIFFDNSKEWTIDNVKLRFLSFEASLLDVASLRVHESGIAEDLILRFLSKYAKKLSREKLWELLQYRYIRAINRVRSLSKSHGYMELYTICLDIIKKEGWWCYLNL